jgi:outer membrane protein TolC
MHIHFLVRAFAIAAVQIPAAACAAPLSFDTALALAVQHSESTHAARAGASGASEMARAAGQLPDPMLTVGVENLPVTGSDRFSTAREPMTQKVLGFSQEWVSQEKRAARQAAAQASAARERAQALTAIADTRLQTAMAYLDAYYATEMLKLATANEHHAHEELAASRARLASSTSDSQDVLALTSALGMSEDESAEVAQQQSAARLALQRWVGAAVEELLPTQSGSVPTEQGYVGSHPLVVAAQRDLEVARLEAAFAASNRDPNWTWSVSYGQRVGNADMVSFGLSVPLPVSRAERQDRETSAKLALVEKSEAALNETTRIATAEYKALASDVQRLQERIERYRSAVATPARQRTVAAMAAYRSNQAALPTVFEARHAELAVARKALALERDLAKTRAQLAYRPLVLEAPP